MSVDYYSSTAADGTILTAKYTDLDVGASGDVSQAQLDDAALFAYSVINSRLGKRYSDSVPFPLVDTGNTPDAIHEISDMLCVAQVKAASMGHSVMTKGPWTKLYEAAMEWLDRLAKGIDVLPEQTFATSGLTISTEGEHPIFGLIDDDFDMGQDADQADRIADERD